MNQLIFNLLFLTKPSGSSGSISPKRAPRWMARSAAEQGSDSTAAASFSAILETMRSFMGHSINRRWILGLAVSALTAASYAQWSNPAEDVPAYHSSAPLNIKAIPPILHGAQLKGPNFRYHWQVRAYELAAQIPGVIYQLPCNCRCDRSLGHTSLHSCYETIHSTECDVCAAEGFYAYFKT